MVTGTGTFEIQGNMFIDRMAQNGMPLMYQKVQ